MGQSTSDKKIVGSINNKKLICIFFIFLLRNYLEDKLRFPLATLVQLRCQNIFKKETRFAKLSNVKFKLCLESAKIFTFSRNEICFAKPSNVKF